MVQNEQHLQTQDVLRELQQGRLATEAALQAIANLLGLTTQQLVAAYGQQRAQHP
jgi:hypothetical protein